MTFSGWTLKQLKWPNFEAKWSETLHIQKPGDMCHIQVFIVSLVGIQILKHTTSLHYYAAISDDWLWENCHLNIYIYSNFFLQRLFDDLFKLPNIPASGGNNAHSDFWQGILHIPRYRKYVKALQWWKWNVFYDLICNSMPGQTFQLFIVDPSNIAQMICSLEKLSKSVRLQMFY